MGPHRRAPAAHAFPIAESRAHPDNHMGRGVWAGEREGGQGLERGGGGVRKGGVAGGAAKRAALGACHGEPGALGLCPLSPSLWPFWADITVLAKGGPRNLLIWRCCDASGGGTAVFSVAFREFCEQNNSNPADFVPSFARTVTVRGVSFVPRQTAAHTQWLG